MSVSKAKVWNSRAWQVYTEFRRWCVVNDTVPNKRAFWERVLTAPPSLGGLGVKMGLSSYRWCWARLVEDGLIRHEPLTNAIVIAKPSELESPELVRRVLEFERSIKKPKPFYDRRTLAA